MGSMPFNHGASPERMFDTLDANKDGMISKDEFLTRHAPSDAHRSETKRPEGGPTGPEHSGAGRPGFGRPGMSGPEFGGPGFGRPGFGPFGQGPGMSGPPPVDMIFGRLDRNHDGNISTDEAPEFIWERMSAADANKDGVVSKEEMEKHRQMMHRDQKSDPRDQQPKEEKPKTPSA